MGKHRLQGKGLETVGSREMALEWEPPGVSPRFLYHCKVQDLRVLAHTFLASKFQVFAVVQACGFTGSMARDCKAFLWSCGFTTGISSTPRTSVEIPTLPPSKHL